MWEIIFLLKSIKSGTFQDSQRVEVNSVSSSHITTTKPVYYHLDGEIKEKATSFRLQVAPQALKVMF